ncbi:protein arginine methyltransferase 3 [Gorgonomyces haynaldii]|nr:protein arginine methyltransferase 3 [Gorgonomyces haynaldii]
MSDDEFDNYDGWEENSDLETQCLFCQVKQSVEECLMHMETEHAFSLKSIQKQHKLDLYGIIRLVNYVRKNPTVTIDWQGTWLQDDSLLIPVIENDPLLFYFDIDSEDEEPEDELQQLKLLVHLQEKKLKDLSLQYKDYQQMVQTVLMSDNAKNALKDDSKVDLDEDELDYYFGGYAHTEIHETMLKDTVRTEAYRDFMYDNKHYFKDKIVLDVGCGTGILSMFAAKAGAKHVYAVDNSTIIRKAQEIATENGLGDKITFVRGRVEDIILPVDQVDVIVSEWMGYFLLFEGMLDSVIAARNKWLKPDGIMAPSRAIIYLTAIDNEDWYNDKCTFWNDVYGFKMQQMKRDFFNDGQVDFIDPQSVFAQPVIIKDIDTKSTTVENLDFVSNFELCFDRDGTLHALCGWFDTDFEGPDMKMIRLSTSGLTTPTHWKQTCFALERPVAFLKGQTLRGTFKCQKNQKNGREVDVEITLDLPVKVTQKYQVR